MNRKYINILVASLLLVFACDDKLDLTPRQQIPTDEVLTSSENVISVLNGAYAGIKGTYGNAEGGELYGGDFNFFSELLATTGDIAWSGSFDDQRQFEEKSILVNNVRVRDSWIRAYDVIHSCNLVLQYIDVVEEGERERVQGEALAVRALVYFDLVRFWGRPWVPGAANNEPEYGVPLVLTPTLSLEDVKEVRRNTVAEVYRQVLEDLTSAKALLESYGRNGTGLSTYGASALLSRVYLQQGEYEKAAIEADRVISSGIFAVTDEPLKAFNTNSNTSEDIFAIQQSALSNAGTSNAGLATHYASLFGSGRADMEVQEEHLERYEEGDLRAGIDTSLVTTSTSTNVTEMFYIGVNTQKPGNIHTSKWGDPNLNIQVIRLSEMYLTRAEGNFEAGTTHGATPEEDINVIRERAGLDPVAAVTREDIRRERRLELAFEGHILHDLKRWQEPIGDLPFDAPELILPIPEREMEANKLLKQNDNY